jgi:Vault protein inter-alpha-trypsin domain
MRWHFLAVFATLAFCAGTSSRVFAGPNPALLWLEDGIERKVDPEDAPSPQNKRAPKGLYISEMAVDAQIHGRLATVTIEARLFNATDEGQIEARFKLAMPDDAVITGYALDVKGVLIDGQLIDQPKAKAVYEAEVRGTVDPGLGEVTNENLFQTRVYPIDDDESRVVRVTFVAPLDPAGNFALPLETAQSVDKLSIKISVEGYDKAPNITLPFTGKLALVKTAKGWAGSIADIRGKSLNGALTIAGGAIKGKMLVSEHSNRRSYFQIADRPDTLKVAPPVKIERVRIYWDSSLSRKDNLIEAELGLVDSVINTAKSSAIDIVRFSSGPPEVKQVVGAKAARAFLGASLYRGGTIYKDLDDVALPDADLCLLFSDGSPTLHGDAEFRPNCRLVIISSAKDANSVRLGRMAKIAKGQFIRLGIDNREAIVARILKPAVTVVDVRDAGGARVPFRSLSAPAGGWFVVGRIPDSGDVEVRVAGLGRGLKSFRYTVETKSIGASDAAGALWATERVAELADNPLKRDEMREIALKHQVASPTMAFIVLESAGQYVRYDIKPPKGFDQEWMDEYRDGKKSHEEQKKEARKERMDTVVKGWAERKKWWNTTFVKPDDYDYIDEKVADQTQPRRPQASETGNATAAADAAPPARARPLLGRADGGAEDESADIIVTGTATNYNVQEVASPLTAISAVDAAGKKIELKLEDILSDQPYIKALDAAKPADRMRVFAEQEKIFGSLTAFWFESAEWFRLKGDATTARLLMLSALELPTADDETRSIVAFRLQRDGDLDGAIKLFDLMAATTEFRPQPKRSLALALAKRGQAKGGSAGLGDLQRAFSLLSEVVLEPHSSAFDGIEMVALMEANALIPKIEAAGGTWELDPRLVGLLDTDLRIVIEWTNDDADIDLWITEPTGEKVSYSNTESELGGVISNDMTDGYGPEEYLLRRAWGGVYNVIIDGYAPDRLNPNGKGRIMVRMIRNFGRPNQTEDLIDAELSFEEDKDGNSTIATLTVPGDGRVGKKKRRKRMEE